MLRLLGWSSNRSVEDDLQALIHAFAASNRKGRGAQLERIMNHVQAGNEPRHSERMTHIILTPLFPPSRFGGIEKIVDRLSHGFAEMRDNVLVFAFDPNPTVANNLVSSLLVTRVKCPIINGSLATIIEHQHAMVERVAASSIPPGPRLIHAHDWFVAGAALELRRCLNTPLVVFFHGDKRSEYSDQLDGDRKVIHSLQQQLAHEADLVFCYSRFMRSCLAMSLQLDPARVVEFRCGMDEDALPRDATVLNGPPRLLYLGRLAREKDVATLLRAFRQVLTSLPQSRLRIVGDGSERAALVDLANATNIAGHVDFLPFTSCPETIDHELRLAHALVLPSIFEPFGIVVLEAISRGVPVVVPSVGGPSEIVENDVSGFTFMPGHAGELAERILTCLHDPARATILAKAAHRHAVTHFRWSGAVRTIRERCYDLSCSSFAVGGLS